MNRVGFFRACGAIAAKDLRLEWRTWESLSSSIVFSLITLVIFNFAFGLATVRELGAERLVPGVIWIVLAFAAVVGMTRSFEIERRHDTLGALFLAPVDRAALYGGKLAANLVKFMIVQAAIVPLCALFFDFELASVALPLAAVLVLHGLGLAELGTLFAAVVTRIGRGEALVATLLLPASAPLFISAVETTATLLEGEELRSVSNWLLLTAGFDALYGLLALLIFEFVLED